MLKDKLPPKEYDDPFNGNRYLLHGLSIVKASVFYTLASHAF